MWSVNMRHLVIGFFLPPPPPPTHTSLSLVHSDLEYDPEVFADQELPVLIVGTKHVS